MHITLNHGSCSIYCSIYKRVSSPTAQVVCTTANSERKSRENSSKGEASNARSTCQSSLYRHVLPCLFCFCLCPLIGRLSHDIVNVTGYLKFIEKSSELPSFPQVIHYYCSYLLSRNINNFKCVFNVFVTEVPSFLSRPVSLVCFLKLFCCAK